MKRNGQMILTSSSFIDEIKRETTRDRLKVKESDVAVKFSALEDRSAMYITQFRQKVASF